MFEKWKDMSKTQKKFNSVFYGGCFCIGIWMAYVAELSEKIGMDKLREEIAKKYPFGY